MAKATQAPGWRWGRLAFIALAAGLLCACGSRVASADLVRGVEYIVAGVFEVPRSTLAGTFGGFPVFGTVFGLLSGTLRGLAMVTRGTLELLPVAAKLAPLIPVFL